MQRRILRSTLGISVTMIVLMTLATLWGAWAATTSAVREQLVAEAEHIAGQLHSRWHDEGEITAADLQRVVPPDHRLELTTISGTELAGGDATTVGPVVERTVTDVGVMRLIETSGQLRRSHVVAIIPIVTVGLVLALVAIALSIRTSRRLTEPINELATHAEQIRSGDLRPSEVRYDIPELDRLAESMDASVVQVAALLAEERRMSVDASHQLKTPLTALSLRLEELAEWPDDGAVRAEARQALDQVERLSQVVDDLLVDRRARHGRRVMEPLHHVVEQQLSEWRPVFDAAGRRLAATVDVAAESTVVDAGPVGQVLAALIENSLVHGGGSTTVEAHRPHEATWVEVHDEGDGIPDAVADRVFERDVSGSGGTGLGLAAAQDAAVSVGGRIALVKRCPAHFRFYLDGREDPPAIGPEPEESAQADADDVR